MKWGMSPLDWRCHAINEHRDHPNGVLIAECGHRLMIVTSLHARSTVSRARRAPRNSRSRGEGLVPTQNPPTLSNFSGVGRKP
jgi:hypothetical protein